MKRLRTRRHGFTKPRICLGYCLGGHLKILLCCLVLAILSTGCASDSGALRQDMDILSAGNQDVGEFPPDFSEPFLSKDAPGTPSSFDLENILFARGDSGELVITLQSAVDIPWLQKPGSPGRLHFVFPMTSVPPSLSKVYQLHEFSHPVKNAVLRNTLEGSELIVSATGPINMEPKQLSAGLRFTFDSLPATDLDQSAEPGAILPRSPSAASQGQRDSFQDQDDHGFQDAQTVFPGMRQDYIGDPISIDLQNIEVEHVLRLISEIAGYNLILDPEVSGRISMKLDNVPWDQVLDLVLIQKGLGKVQVGNILRISTIQRLGAESKMISDARAEAARARIVEQELEPVQTTFIQVNYSTAAEMDARTRPFLTRDRGTMSHDPRTNMLIVTDIPANIRKIRGVVERLDRPERQVLIEARVVYATENFQRAMGIQWGGGIEGITTEYYRGIYGAAMPGPVGNNPGGVGVTGYLVNAPFLGEASTFGIGGFISKLFGPDMFTLDAKLQLGEVQGDSRTVSSPRIVTLNNYSAEIEQGMSIATQVPDERGTRTEYVDAVLKLTVLPQITPDDNLILDLFVSDDTAVAGGDIEKKQARTKLLVEDGQILVLGGVLKTTERLSERRVPGAADIPLLGWLFKNRLSQQDKQELLIFIRPTIL